MKSYFLLTVILVCFNVFANAQTNYTWNGNTSTAWNVATNWTPNGIPSTTDNVTIVTGSRNCNLVANTTINNIIFTSGTLDLGNATITANGTTATFTAGTIQNGTLTISGATTTTIGSSNFTMNCMLNVTSAAITITKTTFQNTTTITKTGATNDQSSGNNIFNGALTITNSGTGYILLGNGNADQFNSTTTFNNTGSSQIYVAYNSSNNIFNGVTTFNNTPTGNSLIYVGWLSANTAFNNNIIVNSTNGQGVQFCGGNATASATLANTKTITIGSLGFTAGTLLLNKFTQVGSTAQTLSLTNTATFTTSGSTTFNGALTLSSPNIYLAASTFNGSVLLTKTTGTNSNPMTGGNTFNSTLTVNYNSTLGNGYWSFGNGAADIYNGDVYSNNNSLDRIIFGHASANNQFNGNLIITQIGSSVGTSLAWNSGATSIMAAGKTISFGSNGFTTGYLYLQGITQNGTAPINLTTTGSSSVLIGEGASYTPSTFGGAVNITSPDIYVRGGTFNGATNFTKTGGGSNHNNQRQNIFNASCTINQQSSGGYFMLGYNSNDLFNDSIIVSATGSGGVYLGNSSGTGTPTLAAGKNIFIGNAGFGIGTLQFGGFIQNGTTAINLTLTGTATLNTYKTAANCIFNGAFNVNAPNLNITGATFNAATTLTKTNGVLSNAMGGGNTFNSTLTVNYTSTSGNGYWSFGNGAADIYNGDVYSNNNSLDRIIFCHASAGNQFNGNIIITQTGASVGTALAWNGTSTSTLAAGKTISFGSNGFTNGYLFLQGITQNGTTPINLTATGTSAIYIGEGASYSPCIFGGKCNISANDIYVRGGTFNSAATFTKTGGTSNHNNQRQNIFNGSCTINQQSNTGYFMLGYNSNELFNDSIIVSSIGTGGIYLGWQLGSTSTPTLAAGKNIFIGNAGYSAGTLSLGGFIQTGNTTGINLNLTGTSSFQIFKNTSNCIFNGSFNITAPDISVQGGTFNADATFTKTGGTSNHNNQQQNIFNSTCTINQQSNTGYFMLGYNSNDLFNDNIIVTSTGTGGIYLGWSSGTGTPTLAAGKTISIGAAGFSAGSLNLNTFTQLGSAPMNLTLTGASTSINFARTSAIGGNLTITAPSIYFNGCTFNGAVAATKNGSTSDNSSGGNTFNGTVSITNSGTGYVLLGNGSPDIFNSTATFNNTGSNQIYVAYNSTNNVFNGVTTFNNTPTANVGIFVSWYGINTLFNDNIVVSSTNGQGIQFNGAATATTTLAAGKTILLGAGGFSAGTLLLQKFTQQGSTPISLSMTGTSNLTLGPSSTIGGDLTTTSGALLFNGCTFNGITNCTKTGSTGDWGQGGNTFNGTSTFINNGSSYLLLGGTNPDIWNADATFTDAGSERILPAYSSIGNQFNGNIYVNTSGAAQGIQFCGGNATATTTLASGKTIQAGSTGLNAGYLILKQFTQAGSGIINLTMASTASYLQFGPSSSIGGNVTSSSPGLYFNGCTFGGTVNSTKTGSTNDASNGNNIFNAAATFNNSGSGYLMFGNGTGDQFNAAATFNNTGTNQIYVAYNSSNNTFGGVTTFTNSPTNNSAIYVAWYSANTLFNDNIIVNSTFGSGVQFCGGNASANATLAAAKTISVGSNFSAGTLLLQRFTQTGNTTQTFNLTGTATLNITSSSRFDGNITASSPSLFFNGSTFNKPVIATKTGSTNDGSTGGNTFNDVVSITNTGAGYFMMGNGSPDVFNAAATFINRSSAQHMYIAYNSTGNIFNGDVTFTNQPTSNSLWIYLNAYGINTQYNGNITISNVNGAGVYFGNNTGSATLATGKTISIGAGGFNAGGLVFKSFTQSGTATPQTLTTTGTSYIQYGSAAQFDGALTSTSPGLYFNGCSFNSAVNCTKNGTTNDQSTGNNNFNGATTITNTGTGYLMLAVTTADAYNNNVTFVQSNTGVVYPNYNNTSTYSGNVTVTSPAATSITFGSGNGTAKFTGNSGQNISITAGSAIPVFTRLQIANTGAGVTLSNTGINVSNSLTLTSGLLKTTSTYLLTMLNGSTTAAGTALSTSYVNGPMRYQKSASGITTLNFPVGNGADCRPVSLTVNHSTATLYNYLINIYNASAAALNYTLPFSVFNVSQMHYYTITRSDASNTNQPSQNLSGNQTIKIFFGANDIVTDGANLTIVKNTSAAMNKWIDIGGTGAPANNGSNLTGSVSSTSSPANFNSFSTFALGNKSGGVNVLPVELISFTAALDTNKINLDWQTATESNNDYFEIEKSIDGNNFEYLQKVKSKSVNGTSRYLLDYQAEDINPNNGYNFYRLKQFNIDGTFEYSKIVVINYGSSSTLGEDEKVELLSSNDNPTLRITTPSSWQNTEYDLSIYNQTGQLLKQFETFNMDGGSSELKPLDMGYIEPGLYVAVLSNITQKRKKTFKLIK